MPDSTKLAEEDYDPEDADEDCLSWDVTFSIGTKEVADKIFKILSEFSASADMLNSDAEDFDDGEELVTALDQPEVSEDDS